MNTLNSLLIEGTLVRDPILRSTEKGTPLCTFSIAANRYYKTGEGMQKETSFFDVESWGREAEAVHSVCKKGRGVRVTGRMKQERWTTEKGDARSRVVIVAEHVEFKSEYAKESAQAEQ
jgi:single-strand DNA-binding protein